ncbi:MAG: PepSY domain-containing protein, partial [Thermoanaerobaculaceae bacterium]|nr:PepSY domain-containing protein [Thermoanaerobaculaceae bacterium]
MFGKKVLVMAVLMVLTVALLTPAVVPKKAQSTLDDLVMASSRLRVPQNIETIDNLRAQRSRVESLNPADMDLLRKFDRVAEGWDQFLTFTGGQWQMLVDERTGLPALVEGSGEPWIPGAGNSLRAEALGEITVSKMESIARDFMLRNSNLFPISQNDLVLVPEGTVEVGGYFWHIQFQYVKNGIPVEGARVVFRVNNGNLVQFGCEKVNPNIDVDTVPSFEKETAWEILGGYVGGWEEKDVLLEPGRLLIVPVAPAGDDGMFKGTVGSGLEYRLVYEVVFHREGVMGTWKARIDAHSGEILSFVDQNMYGSVTGGIYPNSNLDTEVIRPFPKITVTNSTTKTCDMGGNYTYASGTATASIKGAYVSVTDSCGTSSLSTSTAPGDLAFSKSSGTDCTTPGVGGSGNTHAARSTYFHLTLWKERALGFLPSNTWLSSALTDKVNLSQTCNAYWSGSYVAFFKSGGGCSNTGELPTVFLHEAGHGLDSNDGSGSSTVGSSESYGDANAFLQTHDSCVGTNFIPGYKCSGYGDACTTCTGIRDADYAKHSSGTPHKPSQLANTSGFHCSKDSSYPGPCGYEGHCESYIMSEVLWDLAARDLPAAGLDATTSWYIADRLF